MNNLSDQVQQSVDEAIGNLRNALSFASRSECASTIVFLGKILKDLEDVRLVDQSAGAMKRFQQQYLSNFQDGSSS